MKRYIAFELLSARDQQLARRQFSPIGRRDGWERIERWAFRCGPDGRLRSSRYIEPAYTLAGAKIEPVWNTTGGLLP